VAGGERPREALGVILRRRESRLFRSCPICGSRALSWVDREDAENGLVRWLSRCGECRTWRADVLTRRDSRRFARHLGRERKRLEVAVLRLPWADPDRELRAVNRSG